MLTGAMHLTVGFEFEGSWKLELGSWEVDIGTPDDESAPVPKQPAHEYELTDVIGRVVGDQHQLTQIRLAAAVRNPRLEIEPLVGRELLE